MRNAFVKWIQYHPILTVLYVLALGIAGNGLWRLARRPPEPITITVELPPRAEVRPARRVHAGTFKIEESMNELTRQAASSPFTTLVSYGPSGNGAEVFDLNYWLSRGDGTFTFVNRSFTPWGELGTFGPGRVERQGNRMVIHPTRLYAISRLLLLFAAAVALITFAVHMDTKKAQ